MKTIITLAIISLLSVPVVRAEVVTKGGAAALLKAPVVRTEARVKAMDCGMCKSEFVTRKAPASKGSAPASTLIERHACVSCGNIWVTTGHGKAKAEVAKHTCGGCTI